MRSAIFFLAFLAFIHTITAAPATTLSPRAELVQSATDLKNALKLKCMGGNGFPTLGYSDIYSISLSLGMSGLGACTNYYPYANNYLGNCAYGSCNQFIGIGGYWGARRGLYNLFNAIKESNDQHLKDEVLKKSADNAA